MYNEEAKLAFLAAVPGANAQSLYRRIFKYAEDRETAIDLDLSDWDKEQVIDLLNSKLFTDLQPARDWWSKIHTYQEAQHGDAPQITAQDLDFAGAIRTCYLPSPKDLLDEMKIGIEFDQGYAIVPALCFAWMGLNLETILQLPKKSVDLNQRVVIVEAEVFDIEPCFIEVLELYKRTAIGQREQNGTHTVRFQDNGFFLHQMVSNHSEKEIKALPRSSINKSMGQLNAEIAKNTQRYPRAWFADVRNSGTLYRLHQAEHAGLHVFDSFNEDKVQAIFFGKYNYSDNIFKYRQYKKAFNLE